MKKLFGREKSKSTIEASPVIPGQIETPIYQRHAAYKDNKSNVEQVDELVWPHEQSHDSLLPSSKLRRAVTQAKRSSGSEARRSIYSALPVEPPVKPARSSPQMVHRSPTAALGILRALEPQLPVGSDNTARVHGIGSRSSLRTGFGTATQGSSHSSELVIPEDRISHAHSISDSMVANSDAYTLAADGEHAGTAQKKSFWGVMIGKERARERPLMQPPAAPYPRAKAEKVWTSEAERDINEFWFGKQEAKMRDNKSQEPVEMTLTMLIGYMTATHSEDWGMVMEVCERAGMSDAGAKEAVKALGREFKYGAPAAQLSAARLLAIMLRNSPMADPSGRISSSNPFLSHAMTRKFLDVLENCITSPHTSPVVKERLLSVVAAASYASGRSDAAKYNDIGFRGLWRRVKPPNEPDEGIPFDMDDAMFAPPPPSTHRSVGPESESQLPQYVIPQTFEGADTRGPPPSTFVGHLDSQLQGKPSLPRQPSDGLAARDSSVESTRPWPLGDGSPRAATFHDKALGISRPETNEHSGKSSPLPPGGRISPYRDPRWPQQLEEAMTEQNIEDVGRQEDREVQHFERRRHDSDSATERRRSKGDKRQHRHKERRKTDNVSGRVIAPEEDMRRLFQECKIGKGHASLLSQALVLGGPGAMESDVIKEFYLKCRASHEIIYTQIPWASAGARKSAREREEIREALKTAQHDKSARGGDRRPSSDASSLSSNSSYADQLDMINEPTKEERLLAALLSANGELLEAINQYDDMLRIAEGLKNEVNSHPDSPSLVQRERLYETDVERDESNDWRSLQNLPRDEPQDAVGANGVHSRMASPSPRPSSAPPLPPALPPKPAAFAPQPPPPVSSFMSTVSLPPPPAAPHGPRMPSTIHRNTSVYVGLRPALGSVDHSSGTPLSLSTVSLTASSRPGNVDEVAEGALDAVAQPSEKALGKRRAARVEDDGDPPRNADDAHAAAVTSREPYAAVVEEGSLDEGSDAGDDSESSDDHGGMWQRGEDGQYHWVPRCDNAVRYAYDAVAERTRQRLEEGMTSTAVSVTEVPI